MSDARARGDLFTEANLSCGVGSAARLLRDQPEEARAASAAAMNKWSQSGFHVQHFFLVHGDTEAYLYQGDGPSALRLTAEFWPALKRSLLLHVHYVRVAMLFTRGRAAVASAATAAESERRALFRRASADAASLEREGAAWASLFATLIRASAAGLRGDRQSSVGELERAQQIAAQADMRLHGAAVSYALGRCVGDDRGAQLCSAAIAWMREQKIVAPERVVNMLIPGTV